MTLKTNREFVSAVIGELRLLSKDGRISRRLVLSRGQDKARLLLSQKLDEMTLYKEEEIISHVSCFQMCEVSVKECGIFEFNICDSIMKSKHKIPYSVFGKIGPAITLVTNVDRSIRYNYITPQDYLDLQKRKYRRESSKYYTIEGGYMYLPDSTNEIVEFFIIALNKWEVDQVSDCKEVVCKSYWDYEFVCPSRLYESVVTNTVQELISTYLNVTPDTNPNLDSNLKTKTSR